MSDSSETALERLKGVYFRNEQMRRLPLEAWERALQAGKLHALAGTKHPLFRLRRDFRGFAAGTVFGPGITLPGFPHIPRLFRLSTGVPRYFRKPFFAEEKIEGYNVRLFRIGGEILALTRRGFICPFATDRFPDFLPDLPRFLDDHPDLCVCVEVAGPGNPFVGEWPPYIREDVRFFVFDLMKVPEGRLLPPEEKYALLETYGFPRPEIHGPFEPGAPEPLLDLLRRYEAEGREGVVLKESGGGTYLKYATPASHLEDLRVVFPYLGDVPPEYLTHRLVRYVLSRWELAGSLSGEEWSEVGRRLLAPLSELLRRVDEGEPVTEAFRLRFRTERALRALLAHFRHARVKVEVRKVEKKEGYLVVELIKIYPRATAFWKQKLEGFAVVD